MARICEICSKWTSTWNNRSHSNRATRRKFKANIISKKNWFILNNCFFVRKICSRCYKKYYQSGVLVSI